MPHIWWSINTVNTNPFTGIKKTPCHISIIRPCSTATKIKMGKGGFLLLKTIPYWYCFFGRMKILPYKESGLFTNLHGTVEPIATWRGVTGKTRWTGQLLRNNVHVPLYRTSVANLSFWLGEYMLANILRGVAANICRSKKINPSLLVSEKLVSTKNQCANSYWISMAFNWLISSTDFNDMSIVHWKPGLYEAKMLKNIFAALS